MKNITSLFDMAAITVVSIKKNKDKIMPSVKNVTPVSAKLGKKQCLAVMEDMERPLSLWTDDMCIQGDSLMTNITIQEKAHSLYQDLVMEDDETVGAKLVFFTHIFAHKNISCLI